MYLPTGHIQAIIKEALYSIRLVWYEISRAGSPPFMNMKMKYGLTLTGEYQNPDRQQTIRYPRTKINLINYLIKKN